VQPRRQARKYVIGLMGDVPRKNCWALAEQAGDAPPDRMRTFLEEQGTGYVLKIPCCLMVTANSRGARASRPHTRPLSTRRTARRPLRTHSCQPVRRARTG
jgi:hypothetical protein